MMQSSVNYDVKMYLNVDLCVYLHHIEAKARKKIHTEERSEGHNIIK